MVANHTSYLDIIVLGGAARVSFVAKSEVNTWPFFGLMARLYETVFVERQRRSQAGVARDQLRERLQQGDALGAVSRKGPPMTATACCRFKSALMGATESQLGARRRGPHPLRAGAAGVARLCRLPWAADGTREPARSLPGTATWSWCRICGKPSPPSGRRGGGIPSPDDGRRHGRQKATCRLCGSHDPRGPGPAHWPAG